MIEWVLYCTKVGDWLLWLLEQLTGLTIVPVDSIDDAEYEATEKGVLLCTKRT